MRTIDQVKSEIAGVQAQWDAESAKAASYKAVDRLQNEGGEGFSQAESISEQAFHKFSPLIAALRKELFGLEWTAEVTADRRAAWNAAISANAPKSTKELIALEKTMGFELADLKRAVALYK